MPALTAEHLDAFVAAAFVDPPSRERLDGMRVRLGDSAWAARRRYVCDARGAIVAVSWMVPDDDALLLVAPRTRDGLDVRAASLVDELVAVARDQAFRRVDLQVEVGRCTDALVAASRRTGAVERDGRVEFEAPLDQLPGNAPGDGLVFDPAPDRATAAAVLARCASDEPDGLEPGASPRRALHTMLGRPRRTRVLEEVVHLGRRRQDARFTAFVCAQVDPADGWSTITLLALDPALRGQGLGAGLQRHGFAMLRAQGGRVYRGGTSLSNVAMRGCFARNGVPEVARYRRFRWTLSPRPPGGSS